MLRILRAAKAKACLDSCGHGSSASCRHACFDSCRHGLMKRTHERHGAKEAEEPTLSRSSRELSTSSFRAVSRCPLLETSHSEALPSPRDLRRSTESSEEL